MPPTRLSALHLARLAHAVLDGDTAPSCALLLVEADDDGVSLWAPAPEEVAGLDLFEQALGLVASDSCAAVAMASAARAWREEGPAFDVHVAHAVLRSGPSATHLTDVAGAPLLVEAAPEGAVPDLCRRVLGLPTPAPTTETDAYLLRTWLDRVLEAAAARPGALDVSTAMSLHPAEQAEPFGGECTWLHLALATHQFARTVPWAVLRRRFAADGDDRAAQAAAWFDDGSFSRWMLAPLPNEQDALAALEDLVGPAVLHELVATVALVAELGAR